MAFTLLPFLLLVWQSAGLQRRSATVRIPMPDGLIVMHLTVLYFRQEFNAR